MKISKVFDFKPRRDLPAFVPAMAAQKDGEFFLISGFEKAGEPLIVTGDPTQCFKDLWSAEKLCPLEQLRFQRVLGIKHNLDYLLELPLDFQNFLDDRHVNLKNLSPFKYLKEWSQEIYEAFILTKPTSSQVQVLIDLLTDLKLMKSQWSGPVSASSEEWIERLRRLRFPVTTVQDSSMTKDIGHLPWPKGVTAKWERRGDQAQVIMTARIQNPQDWMKLQESINRISLDESFQ